MPRSFVLVPKAIGVYFVAQKSRSRVCSTRSLLAYKIFAASIHVRQIRLPLPNLRTELLARQRNDLLVVVPMKLP